jgi:AcrR family transcriptional regulator
MSSLIEQTTAPADADGRKVRGDRTRRAILTAAVNVASVEGLEGLSIGRLASELRMSKSGLFAHFGSKEELQVSTVRAAAAIFVHRVIRPAEERFEPGIARLQAMLDDWLDYMERGIFAGGCFFAAATVEMDGRPGPVRDAVATQMASWAELLADCARVAIERGELVPDTDPEQLAFELDALGTAVNSGWQLHDAGRAAIAAAAA